MLKKRGYEPDVQESESQINWCRIFEKPGQYLGQAAQLNAQRIDIYWKSYLGFGWKVEVPRQSVQKDLKYEARGEIEEYPAHRAEKLRW